MSNRWGKVLQTSDKTRLISNQNESTMYQELTDSIEECESFIFNVAFISFGGLQILLNAFEIARNKGVLGKILTSDYLNFTDPKAIRKLLEFENIETRVFLQEQHGSLHSKAYIFKFSAYIKVYIGSSNITETALMKNVEWNILTIYKNDDPFVLSLYKNFDDLWNKTFQTDEHFLSEYESFIRELTKFRNEEKFLFIESTIKPNMMQNEAIQNLHALRSRGENKALVIAATATGKTYMAAFDVKQYKARKLLFLVHREDILLKAEVAFKRVLGSKIDTGIFVSHTKELDHQYVFATIQSFKNIVETLPPRMFDYIVVDESHHAVADSYQKILTHLKPDFMLGMTATPERSDGLGLYTFFENNVALEVRLHDALENELISPFHYFGVKEVEGLDLSDLKDNEVDKLSKRLSTYTRADYIIEKMNLYGFDGIKLKCLAFCASIEHANFMSQAFNERGIKSIALTGDDSAQHRFIAAKELESNEEHTLKVIFTVDIFNEGIDIPSVNTVLLLRPTNSPIIFIQQIGRGLRKIPGKEFVTILDFIGNYSKNFMATLALKGSKFYDKDSLTIAVKNDFPELPGNTVVVMDEITKEQILKSILFENFESLKYLKDQYFSFKNQIDRMPIKTLMQYELFDSSPDPIKFIEHSKTYFNFLLKVEKHVDDVSTFIRSEAFIFYQFLSSMLPIRRQIEFLILSSLMKKTSITFSELYQNTKVVIPFLDDKSFMNAIHYLMGKYLDTSQLKRFKSFIEFSDDHLSISVEFKNAISKYFDYFDDIIKYGLTRFQKEFKDYKYQVPFFKPYITYSMNNAAWLSNFEKTHTAYRGMGVYRNDKDFFLFIDLYKDEDVKESINYPDQLLDTRHIQWASQNSSSPDTGVGRLLVNHLDLGYKLHIFVRKFKNVNGKPQNFIYLGLADYISHEKSKPIIFKLAFKTPIPTPLFRELTEKVNSSKS